MEPCTGSIARTGHGLSRGCATHPRLVSLGDTADRSRARWRVLPALSCAARPQRNLCNDLAERQIPHHAKRRYSSYSFRPPARPTAWNSGSGVTQHNLAPGRRSQASHSPQIRACLPRHSCIDQPFADAGAYGSRSRRQFNTMVIGTDCWTAESATELTRNRPSGITSYGVKPIGLTSKTRVIMRSRPM
jgi:hypothetical protein